MIVNEILAIFLTTFITVFIADLGDKTQFVVLTMSSRHSPYRVFGATVAAFTVVIALSVFLGSLFSELLPARYVAIISGSIFIFTGFYTFFKREDKVRVKGSGSPVFTQTFLMIFFAEFGDKTLLATIALTALYQEPLVIFSGALAAQVINHGIVAFIGGKYLVRMGEDYLKLMASVFFIFIGILVLWGA